MSNRRERRRLSRMARGSTKIVSSPEVGRHISRAREYLQSGHLPQAEQVLKTVLQGEPDNPEACHTLGLVYHQMGRPDQAHPLLEKSVRLAPKVAVYRVNLGAVLQALGDHAAAIPLYRAAIDQDPANARAHSNLGYALRDTGDPRAALDAFRHAYSLQPDHVGTHRGLTSILRMLRTASYDETVAGLLLDCLNSPLTDCSELSVSVATQLIYKYELPAPGQEQVSQGLENNIPAQGVLDRIDVEKLAGDPLAVAFFGNCMNVLIPLEELMKHGRRQALLAGEGDAGDGLKPLMTAIARQAFMNEYIAHADDTEWQAVARLKTRIEDLLAGNAPSKEIETLLLTYAAYAPPDEIDGIDQLLDRSDVSEGMRDILRLTVTDRREEARIKTEIDTFSPIEDTVSLTVRGQYEEHPYPRWIHYPEQPPEPVALYLKRLFPHFEPEDFLLKPDMSVLVAGAGTGRHPINVARSMPRANVLTFDLSLASLAYGIRMARQMGIDNISFLQGDILKSGLLADRGPFDMVQSVGVLHHMEDPLAGWRELTRLLRPGGVFKLGLYSERARQAVVRARDQISRRGLGGSSREISGFRQSIIENKVEGDYADLLACRDFYSTSMVRDLIFHVQEHRYTPARLKSETDSLGLEFLGFEPFDDPTIVPRYRALFPDDPSMVDLENWEAFEERYPDAIPGYVFWCRKSR